MFKVVALTIAFILTIAATLMIGCEPTKEDAPNESDVSTKHQPENDKVHTEPKEDQQNQSVFYFKIKGMVRDKAGTPVNGAEVEVLPARHWHPRSCDGGEFEAEWRPPDFIKQMGEPHLVVRHIQRNLAAVVKLNEDSNMLDVTLEPAAILTGKVVDADGNGMEEALVTMRIKGSAWEAFHPGFMFRTDAEGKFTFRAIPVRHKYALTIKMTGWTGYRASHVEVEIDDASDTAIDTGPIVLIRGEFSISGIVVDLNNKPAANFRVYCLSKDRPASRTVTDADGRFKIDGLFKGKVRLMAGGYGSYGYVQAEAGATDVKIVLDNKGAPPPKGRACFPDHTGVWIDGAVVPISEIARVQAKKRDIERIEEHEGAFECRDILLDSGNLISVVDSHCFMLDCSRWIAAQDLRSGQTLKTITGTVGIKSVTLRPTPYKGKVYNVKISNSDRYTIGKDGVIVRDY